MSPPGLLEIVNASPDSYPPLDSISPFAIGGDDREWDQINQTRLYTNCFVWQPDLGRVCLSYCASHPGTPLTSALDAVRI